MRPDIIVRNVRGVEEVALNTNANKDKKNITKEVKPKLKKIAINKGLHIDKILNLDTIYREDYSNNYEIIGELLQGNHIRELKNEKCYFIEGNKAYKFETEEGQYRYYSYNNSEYFYLNTIDLYVLLSNKNYGDALTELFIRVGMTSLEEQWKQSQRDKYIANIKEIEKAEEWKEFYPTLHKQIKTTLPTLLKLNAIGLHNIVVYSKNKVLQRKIKSYNEK